MDNGISYVADGVVTMHWQSEGDVAGYEVTVYNGGGVQVANATTDKTNLNVKSSNLNPGEVYTLVVTAIPKDNSVDAATAQALFGLYVPDAAPAQEPEPEPVVEPEPEPVPEPEPEPVVEPEPVPEPEPVVEPEPEPEPEEDVVYVQGDNEADYQEYDDYDDTSDDSYEEETYEESYEEEPVEDTYEEEPVEEEPVEEPSYDEPAGDPNVERAQSRLVSWGWLAEGSYSAGVADGATAEAVRSFQSWYNENYGGSLSASGSLDADTLALLLNDSGDVYTR